MRRLALLAFAALLAACGGPAPMPETLTPARPAEVGSRAPASADTTVVVMAEPALAPVAPDSAMVSPAGGSGLVRAGVLTAGDIDDTLNLAAFARYLDNAGTGMPRLALGRSFAARVTGPDGQPAAHRRVTLRLPGAAEPFWDGYSGTDGNVTVFPAALGAGAPASVEMRVFPDTGEPTVATLSANAPRQAVTLPFGAGSPDFLDLVFAVDVTGSMGDELDWLVRDLVSTVRSAAAGAGGVDIRYGLVTYRDHGDAFVVRRYDFTGSGATMRAELRAQSAFGGGDYPEAAADALAAAVDLGWRRGNGERLLFHVADAPPHDGDAGRYLAAAQAAADRQVQIFGLGASGVATEAEFLMRQAAALTGGRYLFLTDDSGVGLSHEEPRVSCYLVTTLTDLVRRVIRSELSGVRLEPAPSEVVRQVGSYQNGVCRD